ncbi:hypothetical protein G9A89_003662 [Geosiphon pyriformis]|nr:hypothetical protein G9A89_003662 [Geosiphon pyriformis]
MDIVTLLSANAVFTMMFLSKEAYQVPLSVIVDCVYGAIKEIRKILATSNKIKMKIPFFESSLTNDTIADDSIVREDYKHSDPLNTLSETGGGALSPKIIQNFPKLLIPGFVSSRFFVRVLLNVCFGGEYCGSTKLAELDIPTQLNDLRRIVRWHGQC